MDQNKLGKEQNNALISLLGILAVLFLIHKRGKVDDQLGKGIREGEGWFVLFLIWCFVVCGAAAFQSNFGVQVDIRILSGIGMLPLFMGLLRFIFADLRIVWLGAVLVGVALLIRLFVYLLTGEPF